MLIVLFTVVNTMVMSIPVTIASVMVSIDLVIIEFIF